MNSRARHFKDQIWNSLNWQDWFVDTYFDYCYIWIYLHHLHECVCGGYRGNTHACSPFHGFVFVLFPASEFFSSFPCTSLQASFFFPLEASQPSSWATAIEIWLEEPAREKATTFCSAHEKITVLFLHRLGDSTSLCLPRPFSWFLCWHWGTVEDRNFLSFLCISWVFKGSRKSHANYLLSS